SQLHNLCHFFFFFFQAEDGIRDATVTGVQTCALPISRRYRRRSPSGPTHAAPLEASIARLASAFLLSAKRHQPRPRQKTPDRKAHWNQWRRVEAGLGWPP